MTAPGVAQHYTTDDLLGRIDAGLRAVGADPDALSIDDLKPADEFHTGGIEATCALLDQLHIAPGAEVIDLGCGIGGPARHIAHRYGARVRGIDLTQAFIEIGRAFNDRLGLSDKVELSVGDITDLPYDGASADLVTMFHVGMNVPDKPAIFAEAARVLKPGGRFALFDVMRDENDEELVFPVPWASRAEISHVAAPGVYRRAAHAAGLKEVAERERRQFALDFFDRMFRKIAAEGPPPLGSHLMMGETAGEKIRNYVANVEARRIAPVEMIFERPKGR